MNETKMNWNDWKYGLPKPERQRIIDNALKSKVNEHKTIKYHGESKKIPVITVRIEVPIYRLANGRTVTLQEEYLSNNADVRNDLFTYDEDSVEAQTAQHDILLKLVDEQGLRAEFEKNGVRQEDQIIVDSKGVVVNGNRRLCLWRELYYNDKKNFGYFEMIDIAVLPDDDEDAIKNLEIELQIKKELKAQYSWHALAAMMLNMRSNGLRASEVGEKLGMSAQQVNKRIDAYNYAVEHLKECDKENQWSLVDDDMEAFEQGAAAREKLKSQPNKIDMYDAMAKIAITSNDPGGRLYDFMKDIGTYIDPITDILSDNLDLPEEDMAPIDDYEKVLLGDEDESSDKYTQVAKALRQLSGEKQNSVMSTIQDAIASEKEAERDNARNDYVKKKVQQANTALREAAEHLGPEKDHTGVSKNIISINEYANQIEEWLKTI